MGWTAAAAGAVVLAWLFGLPELSAVAVAASITLAIGWVVVRRARHAAVTARIDPPAVTRGEQAVLTLTCEVPAGAATTAPTRVRGPMGTAGTAMVATGPMRSGRHATVRVDLPTPDRGIVTVGPLHTVVVDPLGWWQRRRPSHARARLVVRPRVHPLTGTGPGGGVMPAPARTARTPRVGDDTDAELVGLRPYVRGDDLRRIHWRTSARRNEPHVVQVEPPAHTAPVAVVLDTTSDAGTDQAFERAVEAAASVLNVSGERGRPVRLTTTSGWDSGEIGAGEATTLLDVLAEVRPGPQGDLRATVRLVADPETALVVCTGRCAPELPDGLGRASVIVACGRATSGVPSPGGTPPAPRPRPGSAAAQEGPGPLLVEWDGHNTLAVAWATAGARR